MLHKLIYVDFRENFAAFLASCLALASDGSASSFEGDTFKALSKSALNHISSETSLRLDNLSPITVEYSKFTWQRRQIYSNVIRTYDEMFYRLWIFTEI